MDNLTHSLIGAVLGQAGPKRKSGLAMPTLIIAANLPDIDASCTVLGMVSLAMRRGITHGPLAILVLPALLTWAMMAFDKWQARRGTRPEDRLPVRPGWLLALAYIGCLTHPLFDWMNSYGIRLLEPFSHRWFYGDALFIVDPWLLAILGTGIWLSRRREKEGGAEWQRPARIAGVGVAAYVVLNLAISHLAIERGREVFAVERHHAPQMLVANPMPLQFWKRDLLWQDASPASPTNYHFEFNAFSPEDYRAYHMQGGAPDWWGHTSIGYYNALIDPRFRRHVERMARDDPRARAFLFWSRMPVVLNTGPNDPITIEDQRFMDSFAGRSFHVQLRP